MSLSLLKLKNEITDFEFDVIDSFLVKNFHNNFILDKDYLVVEHKGSVEDIRKKFHNIGMSREDIDINDIIEDIHEILDGLDIPEQGFTASSSGFSIPKPNSVVSTSWYFCMKCMKKFAFKKVILDFNGKILDFINNDPVVCPHCNSTNTRLLKDILN